MHGDMTNYSKEKMESLSQDIRNYREKYNNIVNSLGAKINEMHEHWVEDPAAEAVYQQLVSQFNTFKGHLNEGYDQMTNYENLVNTQVDRYTEAEQKALNAING